MNRAVMFAPLVPARPFHGGNRTLGDAKKNNVARAGVTQRRRPDHIALRTRIASRAGPVATIVVSTVLRLGAPKQ